MWTIQVSDKAAFSSCQIRCVNLLYTRKLRPQASGVDQECDILIIYTHVA